jgi:hypothetical protein
VAVLFYLVGIFGILPLLLQDCPPHGSVDFTESAVLQGICGSTLQLHALRLAYAAKSMLAKFRFHRLIAAAPLMLRILAHRTRLWVALERG